ncbi:MAG: asparaginase [Planctomycetota bacterium]|nr:asparaginase [Planctomycetota bacterium]
MQRSNSSPNPVLVRVWRGEAVESAHRGAWVLVDGSGRALDGAGDFETPIYARSAVKSLQALPLLETGAADRFAFTEPELAVCAASHDAEACHVETVRGILDRLGLTEEHLRCGPQLPGHPEARRELERLRDRDGEGASPIYNNCSGKHAGFLALALHLGVPPERYLDPESDGQRLVHAAVAEMAGLAVEDVAFGIDGCSAPTFRLPLRSLGAAFARLTAPDRLAPDRAASCRRIVRAVTNNPVLLGGSHRRLDTDLLQATGGRLYPKIGAEGVYALGVRDAGRALAIKIDDGGRRAVYAEVVGLLERLGLAVGDELAQLERWTDPVLRNRAGLEVGRLETGEWT